MGSYALEISGQERLLQGLAREFVILARLIASG